MTDENGGVSRRAFILSTTGAGAAGMAGAAVGQENNNTTVGESQPAGGGNTSAGEGGNESQGNETGGDDGGGGGGASGSPDYGGWLDGVGNYDGSTVDERGSGEVTITVGAEGNGGAFAFDPPAVWVDTGTTVVWEWTGEGGGHNVNAEEGADFTSETTAEGGFTFEQTLEESGIVKYQCDPHASLGMKGALAVGDDVPTSGGGGGGGGGGGSSVPQIPNSAKTLGIASTMALGSTLGLAYFFMKYGGDYPDE